MIQFVKIILFSVLIIAVFALYSNFGIPQIKPAAPPIQEDVDLARMTMESFIALGDKLFHTKGTCTLCHNPVGGRAPLLENLGDVVPARLKDPRYEGRASDIGEYLIESMEMPSIYVIEGFGKMGTNDQESPMPNVRSGSIGLSAVEVLAIVAYLEDASAIEVSVEIPTVAAPVETAAAPVQAGADRAKYASGEEIVTQLGCGACHKIARFEGAIGPDLSHIGSQRDEAYLRRAVLDPAADITKGYAPMMPPVYGDQLYAAEMEMLVQYLAGLK